MKRGAETHLESSIPLILIAILAVFVAAKFNFIDCSNIPGLSLVCPAPQVKIGVVGHASLNMANLLQAEDFRIAGIQYLGDLDQTAIYPGVLNQFDIIMLQGEQICDRTARKVIADKVKSGGKLIVVADACTKVHDDNTVVGWDVGIGTLGDIMPVIVGGVTHEYEPVRRTSITGKFKIVVVDHPIFPRGQKNFQFSGSVVKVIPNGRVDNNILAYVDTSSQQVTDPAVFAIVESKSLLAGKVMYFAFDPGNLEYSSRNMFLNTLLYLKGARG